ncbi:hypothetical protein HUE46_04900 [Flavobacterium columnare]|uniref:hypothetical protein n=1 Tax=Flavobacterium columnare TaxID=996 RepID=UPI0007F9F046|nr:hypothetical protein [Flavobacterium columnare]ANO47478.1 hypothetical protein Pf1_02023 [Flavobacterium columnare]APT21883.1 hypothetical protein BU993_04055 [Flavobacterium columnare]MBF6652133.1 hypothetical protein [Flavobacterium columnare]QOG89404.1 hypothetical protein HUE41_04900 [Flavobacterium columnare]QOG92064.1 hypothetical protein HUE42_04895 [Flavobacterium columnare]
MKPINITLFLFLTFVTFSCKDYAYILDEKDQKPLENVKVTDLDDSTNISITDKEGKFQFKRCGNVVIQKEGYVKDTLEKFGCKPNGKCFKGHIFYMKRTMR